MGMNLYGQPTSECVELVIKALNLGVQSTFPQYHLMQTYIHVSNHILCYC